MASAVSGGDVACGALGALMAQYAGKALKDHFGKDLTDRQMIAIVQSGAAIFAGMLGKNPSEAAAAALVVMECDILRARGPSAEEIAEAERQEAERKKAEAEAKERAEEEAARVEKRRLQDEEIARQNEKLRKDKEKLAAQRQERDAAAEKEKQPQEPRPEEPNRDFKNEMQRRYGGAPLQVDAPLSPEDTPHKGKVRLHGTPLEQFAEKAQKHLNKCAQVLSPFAPEIMKLMYRGGQVLTEELGPYIIDFYKAYHKYDAIGKAQRVGMLQRLQKEDPSGYRQYMALGIGAGVDPSISVLCPHEALRDPMLALGKQAGYYAENGANYLNLGPGLSQDIGDVTTFLSVFLLGSIADAVQMNPLKLSGLKGLTSAEKSLMRSYVKQMELHAGMHMPKQQRDALANLLREKRIERLGKAEYAAHKSEYTDTMRKSLILDWELNTGLKWPVYTENIIGKSGTIIGKKGSWHQLHHIVFQSHNGLHVWYNIFPLPISGHQQGVHLKVSPGEILQK